MIITKLSGGLGNQMFQYAFGKCLSIRKKTTLKLDIEIYNRNNIENITIRNYQLPLFTIATPIATPKDYLAISTAHKFSSWIYKIGLLKRKYYKDKHIKERSMNYDPNIFKCSRNVIIEGYWQNELYFKQIEKIIRKDFAFPIITDKYFNEISTLITSSTPSVSIHIRRGDYVTNKQANSFHGLCSLEYYDKAIRYIKSKTKETPHFFVFSDDIEWALCNLTSEQTITFVTQTKNHFHDLKLMSQCTHQIIANSSFSWWAAWLNSNKNKIVIAPLKWFNSPHQDNVDVIPKSWIKL